MEGGPRTAEVGPLGHRLEVVHGFGGLDLDRAHELVPAVGRRQHEIRINLDLPDLYGNSLVGADVGHDLMTALQAQLEQPDHAVMFELLAYRPDKNRAHGTSRRRIAFTP